MIFKRPNTTVRVFEAIRAARPAKLFIAADAPRPNVPGKIEKCAAVREIVRNVDQEHFIREFDMHAAGRCNNWDQQWMFSVLDQRGICLISRRFHDRSNANS